MNPDAYRPAIAHWRESDHAVQPLLQHLQGVGQLTRRFASKIGLADAGELIGLLHDLGKYSDEFQAYLKSAVGLLNQDEDEDYVDAIGMRGKVDHSTAGAQFVWQELSNTGALGKIAGQALALCIASHHSGLIDCLASDAAGFGMDAFGRRMGKTDDRTHLSEALIRADAAILSRARELLGSPTIVTGIQASIGNILRTNPACGTPVHKCEIAQQQIGLFVRFLFSCLIDADRIDTADFERWQAAQYRLHGRYTAWDSLIERLEDHLRDLDATSPVNKLRQEISRHCLEAADRGKGAFTLTVPTGGGKTLASLRFALHHAQLRRLSRIICIIPFTSIIDQNARVAREVLAPRGAAAHDDTVVLEHHSNLTPEQQNWREKILSENWDAPIVYTTMVQFLEALLGAGTRGARRMHQLADAVLIFDEVQTLPISCVHLFSNAVNFLVEHCNSTAVLCTATQPLLDKVDPNKGAIRLHPHHELMPDVKKLFDDLKRVEVRDARKPGGWANDEIVRLAVSEAERAGSCLVVVNTKGSAQALHQLCQERCGIRVYHLSANMCPMHRKAVLREVCDHLEHKRPVLCISTQLIEAGVDVDFGAVIRFSAGLDSIAQAAGRCNRNGERACGFVHVVNPREENLSRLPDIRIGCEKAARVMNDYENDALRFDGSLIGPMAMRWYYENYFFSRKAEMEYPVSKETLGHDDTLLNLLSTNSIATHEYGKRNGQEPDMFLRQSFMAAAKAFKAIAAPTRGVIVPFGPKGGDLVSALRAADEVEKRFDLLRVAQQYTVNVFPHVLESLAQVSAVREIQPGTGVLYLDEHYYSPDLGLVTEPIISLEAFCA